jgi:hypothetical protein
MGKRERVRSRKQEKNKSNKHQFRASSTAGVAAEPKTGAQKPAEKASGGKAGGKAVAKAGAKAGAKKPRVQRSVSYSAETSILVVGDGDFTFTKGLVAHLGGSGAKVVATSFDSDAEVNKKYEKVIPVPCNHTTSQRIREFIPTQLAS